MPTPKPHPEADGHCWNYGCLHVLERSCHIRCESEEDIADQIMWLRRCKWKNEDRPWMATQVSTSGHPM